MVGQEGCGRPFGQRGPTLGLTTAFEEWLAKGFGIFTSGFGIGNFQQVPACHHHHLLSSVGVVRGWERGEGELLVNGYRCLG